MVKKEILIIKKYFKKVELKMKNELKNEDEIIAQDGNITINRKELKTSLPKLANELNDVDIRIALKKLMLDIEIRFEILQHIVKPILDENNKLLHDMQNTIRDASESNKNVLEYLDKIEGALKDLSNE